MNKTKRNIIKHLLQCIGICLILFAVEWSSAALNAKLLIAPFGASCAILFCLAESPYAKPKNVIGGYFISSMVGVVVYTFWGNTEWSISLAVAISIFIMLLTNAMHPPAGAVPIIAITSASGWSFIPFPVLTGSIIITTAAVLHNKLLKKLSNIHTIEEGQK